MRRLRGAGRGGPHAESGRIKDVVYLGSVTRYVVELDRGGELRSSGRTSRPPRRRRSTPGAARSASPGAQNTSSRSTDRGKRKEKDDQAPPARRRLGRGGLAVASARDVVAAGRGGSGNESGGGTTTNASNLPTLDRQRRGQAEPRSHGRATPSRSGSSRSSSRPAARCTRKYAGSSDEMVTLMRQGGGSQYDMVSASGDACLRLIRGGDVQPVNVDPDPGLEELHPAAEVAAAQHGRRQALRRLAAVGPEHAALQHEKVTRRADELGGDLRPEVQGQGHGPGQPDPDRRRGAVPVEDAAEPRDQGPVRADPEAVRRGGRPAEAAAAADQEVLGAGVRRDRPVQERRRRRSAPRGRTRRTRSRPRRCRSRTLIPKEGATGWADTWMLVVEGEAPELRLPVDEVDLDAEGAGPAGDLLRRDAGEHEGLPDHGQDPEGLVRAVPRQRAGVVLRQHQVLEDADRDCGERQEGLHGLHAVAAGLDEIKG